MDHAVNEGLRRYRVMESRLDDLEHEIVETRRLAAAAGVFDPRPDFVSELREQRRPAARPMIRQRARLLARTAFARAALRL